MPNDEPLKLRSTRISHDRPLLWVTIALVTCGLACRAVLIGQPVNSDSAMFVYMGKLVSQGGRMGVDLVDNKLPSVGLLMSAPYRLIGPHWWAYGLLGLAMSIAAMLLLTRAAGRCIGPAARWPVLIAAAVWLNFTPAVFGQFQLETVVVFFTSIAAAATLELLTRRDWRDGPLAGLAIGTAMWAKPTAGAILPAIVLAIVLVRDWQWRRRVYAIAAVAVGVMIPLAICGVLLFATGMADALPATLSQLRDYSANSSADAIDLAKPLVVLGLLMLPVLMLGIVFRRDRFAPSPGTPDFGELSRAGESWGEGSVPKLKRFKISSRTLTLHSPGVPGEGQTQAARSTGAIAIFILAWLAMELLAVVSQRRMYAYHFLVLAPPAALLVGLLPRVPSARSMLFAFGPAVAMALTFAVPLMISPGQATRQSNVIGYLKTHTAAGDSAWMDDDARLLVESDLQPGTRVPLIFLFANSDQTPARLSRQMLEDFTARQPRYIVLQRDQAKVIDLYANHMIEMVKFPARSAAFAEAIRNIQHYVEENYRQQTNIDGLVIWRRNDSDRATANLSD